MTIAVDAPGPPARRDPVGVVDGPGVTVEPARGRRHRGSSSEQVVRVPGHVAAGARPSRAARRPAGRAGRSSWAVGRLGARAGGTVDGGRVEARHERPPAPGRRRHVDHRRGQRRRRLAGFVGLDLDVHRSRPQAARAAASSGTSRGQVGGGHARRRPARRRRWASWWTARAPSAVRPDVELDAVGAEVDGVPRRRRGCSRVAARWRPGGRPRSRRSIAVTTVSVSGSETFACRSERPPLPCASPQPHPTYSCRGGM